MRSLRTLRIVGIGLAFAAILASGGLPVGSQAGQQELPPFIVTVSYPDNAVAFIDLLPDGRSTVTKVTVAQGPIGLAVHPERSFTYVVSWDANVLTVIDNKTRRAVGTVSLGEGANPYSVAVRPDGRAVYVVLAGIKQVAVLDTSDAGNPRPLTRIALPGSQAPRNIAFSFSLERQRAFISDSESGRIQIIDAINHQRIGQLETGGRCAIGVKVSNFGRWLYVADRCLSTVYAIEVESLSSARPAITPIPLSPRSGAWYIAFSPDDRFAYVSLTEPRENISSGQIAIIDTEQKRQIGTIAVGGFPAGLQSWHALLFIFNPQSSIQRVSLDPATGAAIGFLPPISTGLTKELIGHFITLCCGKWKWARVGKELKYGYDMDDDGDLDVILDFQNSTFSYDVGGGQYVQIQTRGYVARDDPPGGRRVVVDYDTNGDGNPDRRTILNDTNMDGDFSEEGEVVDTPIGP